MRKTVMALAALLVLAGCETRPSQYDYPPPAYEPPPPTVVTQRAVLPPHAPMHTAQSVKPLGAGTLTAQRVEAYTDTEEAELRAALRGSGAIVGRLGNDIVVNMKSDPIFESNSPELTDRANDAMQAMSLVVRKYDSTQLQVNGYTDTSGSPEHNQQLSQARAGAVAKALIADGVDPKRILARGFGEKGLKIPTGNSVSEPRNRRIEIRITPRMAT